MSDRSDLHRLEMTRIAYRLCATGVIASGSLYLMLVAVLGVIYGSRDAVILGVIATGITYLSYTAQIVLLDQIRGGNRRATQFANAIVALSIVVGAAAGLLLAIDLLVR